MHRQSMIDVVIQELTNVINEQQRVDLIKLCGLGQSFILCYVDQREILSDPFHEIGVLLGNCGELGSVDR